ncbi:hypothetical protein ACQYWY_21860 [Comamonas sediminis]|uniref:hypothetical protein n=1 Tax=Comamonas sediminis TaxID=1783360 RepID=UPI003D2CC83F
MKEFFSTYLQLRVGSEARIFSEVGDVVKLIITPNHLESAKEELKIGEFVDRYFCDSDIQPMYQVIQVPIDWSHGNLFVLLKLAPDFDL